MKTSPLEPWTRPTVGRSSRLSSTKSPWKRMRTTSPPITAPRVLVGAVQPWSVTKHSSPLTLTEPCNVISVHEIFSQCLVSSLLQLSASLLPVTPYHACIAWLSWSLTIALVILAKPTDIQSTYFHNLSNILTCLLRVLSSLIQVKILFIIITFLRFYTLYSTLTKFPTFLWKYFVQLFLSVRI